MADILVSAANGKLPSLPFTPPFVSWEVERFWADVDEFILRQWNSSLQQAISKGREDLNLFLKDAGEINKTYNLRYSLINLSEEFLSKILTKEWCEYDKSSNDFESYITNQSQGKKVASILVQKLEQNDQYNRLTYYHYIHAIYLKDMKL